MSVREISYGADELVHPTFINGRQQWISPEVERIIHKLQHGDPLLGWEGDPRLVLCVDPDGRWVLERFEADGQYRTVCRSRPGLALDERLIQHLVAHDQRRGFDADKFAEANSEQQSSQAEYDHMAEAMERVVWGINRDTHGRSQF